MQEPRNLVGKISGLIEKTEKANRVMDYTLRHYGTSCIAFAELYKQMRLGPRVMDVYVANGYASYEDGSYILTVEGKEFGTKLKKMVEILTS